MRYISFNIKEKGKTIQSRLAQGAIDSLNNEKPISNSGLSNTIDDNKYTWRQYRIAMANSSTKVNYVIYLLSVIGN